MLEKIFLHAFHQQAQLFAMLAHDMITRGLRAAELETTGTLKDMSPQARRQAKDAFMANLCELFTRIFCSPNSGTLEPHEVAGIFLMAAAGAGPADPKSLLSEGLTLSALGVVCQNWLYYAGSGSLTGLPGLVNCIILNVGVFQAFAAGMQRETRNG